MNESLYQRWTPELIDQAEKAFAERKIFAPFPPFVLEGVEYADLRGLVVRHPVRDTLLERVDMSYAKFELVGSFLDVIAIECRFVGAVLDQNIKGTFRNCRFDEANMSGASMYGGTVFSECTFVGADLRRAKGVAIKFLHCDFTSANFRSTHLTESDFYKCNWNHVTFHHSSLGGSRMTRAGFPNEKGSEQTGRLPVPTVILEHVKWLD